MTVEIGMHPLGTTPGITRVFPSRLPHTENCEVTLNIGVFFDGTGNNKDWNDDDGCTPPQGSQYARRKHSNVARLLAAYPDQPDRGYYRIYIEGVGTPCPAIGEDKPAPMGGAMGRGGEGRIHLALLQLLNTLVRAASPGQLARVFDDDTIKALCRNRSTGFLHSGYDNPEDSAALKKVRRSTLGGLLTDRMSTNRESAADFYRAQMHYIEDYIKKSRKPKPVEIMVDIYGFSRGSAAARVFCSWLCELAANGTLCGLPLTVRFLGLFDTVASVGVPNEPSLVGNLANGHMMWAQPQWLRVPAAVRNCLHLVAMHENRASFPVDLVSVAGKLPANCHEFAFPGMHSDVGGGYLPNEQGRGTIDGTMDECDSDKLSQISLSIMLRAAQAAGSPLKTQNAVTGTAADAYNPFLVHDNLRAAYENFHRLRGGEKRQTAQWLMTYLAWRYQARHSYTQLPWRARVSANSSDHDDLDGANALLLDDIAALDNTEGIWKPVYLAERLLPKAVTSGLFLNSNLRTVRLLAPEARAVLKRMRAHPTVDAAEAKLFGGYIHDSVAGFRPWDQFLYECRKVMPISWDLEGYLRYRRFWTGSNEALTLKVEQPQPLPDVSRAQVAHMPQQPASIKGYGVRSSPVPADTRQ
ncbi:Secreted protein Hcp [Paraburkholderia tropica]|uniref:T6SS phospholipase effector Tle1-like catalytic domain-containing protein n=1 Tax=Paraburkholderia tropica TaxID=92647 RepID=UPI001CB43389|nr:DUF2235 domain-containing protein [Paraburkholderia tropica]CAG9194172.1 Secreted protein Hcp [Paraburkholderia tropica]